MKFITLALLSTFAAQASAGPALQDLKTSAGPAAMELARPALPPQTKAAPAANTATLTWNYPAEAISVYGASQAFERESSRLQIRLGFRKGDYDSYSKIYKAVPVVYAIESFLLDDSADDTAAFGFYDLGETYFESDRHYWGGSYLQFSGTGQSIVVKECKDYEGACEVFDSLDTASLYDSWQTGGQKYGVQIGDRKFYMVPQKLNHGNGYTFGYVLTENEPLHPLTGLPQDFIELFRRDFNAPMTFRPKAYSLALGLTFEFKSKYTWEVRPMQDAEVQEAMNEALAGRAPEAGK